METVYTQYCLCYIHSLHLFPGYTEALLSAVYYMKEYINSIFQTLCSTSFAWHVDTINIVGFVNTCYFHITFYNNCPLEVCGTDQWLHSMLNNLASRICFIQNHIKQSIFDRLSCKHHWPTVSLIHGHLPLTLCYIYHLALLSNTRRFSTQLQ